MVLRPGGESGVMAEGLWAVQEREEAHRYSPEEAFAYHDLLWVWWGGAGVIYLGL